MIPYDRHAWMKHVFTVRGSTLPLVAPRLIGFFLLSVGTVLLDQRGHVHDIPPMVHAVLGTVLGLILAFRTNTAYDRFWEGRRAWGLITNRSRDIARQASAFFTDRSVTQRVGHLLAAFVHGTKRHLWKDPSTPELLPMFSEEEAKGLEQDPGVPQRALMALTEIFVRAKRDGTLTEFDFSLLDRNLTELQDQFGVCQRIQRTPIPLAYVVFLRRFIIFYLATLPLALIEQLGWGTPFVMLLVAYALLGIEELGVQIEDPFEKSPSDINLQLISENIAKDVADTLAELKRTTAPPI